MLTDCFAHAHWHSRRGALWTTGGAERILRQADDVLACRGGIEANVEVSTRKSPSLATLGESNEPYYQGVQCDAE